MPADETPHRSPAQRRRRVALSGAVAGLGLMLTASVAFGGIDRLADTVRDGVYDPPKTRIIMGPGGVTSDPTSSFRFASNEDGVSYRCRVDRERYEECDNPHTTARLGDGRHSLDVFAVDGDGLRDDSPAQAEFAIDTREPNSAVARGPRKTRDRTPVFALRSNERQAKFEYQLDRGRYHRTDGKLNLPEVKPGMHVLRVRSTDRAGNRDGSPDAHRFKVLR